LSDIEQYLVSVTGHRELIHSEEEIELQFNSYLDSVVAANPEKEVIVQTGMAIGFDLLVAEMCLKSGVKYIACLPFADHLKTNPIFKILLEQAYKVVVVSEGPYAKYKYVVRDDYLAKTSQEMFAYLVKEGHGGTRLTVDIALTKYKRKVTYFQHEKTIF
jgi:hypothetical protein